jgi:hypothetical protein
MFSKALARRAVSLPIMKMRVRRKRKCSLRKQCILIPLVELRLPMREFLCYPTDYALFWHSDVWRIQKQIPVFEA